MTFHPNKAAGRLTSSQINRVAKISQRDLIDATPDTLTNIKREVNTLDLLKVSDVATYNTRIAAITDARTKQLFFGGNCDMLRYRYAVYGMQEAVLNVVLGALIKVNYGKVGSWYRMAASTAVASEWQTIVDVLGGASLVQNGAVRKLAAGASANAFPIGTYDGTDCMRMPLGVNNYNINKWGLSYYLKSPDVNTSQELFVIYNNDAGIRVMELFMQSGKLNWVIYIGTNVDGRQYTTAGTPMAINVYKYPRIQFDSSKGNEFDTTGSDTNAKVRIFVGETAIALTASNVGAGGALATLRAGASGAAIFSGLNDSDTPVSAVVSGTVHGPNTQIWLDTPTNAEAVAVMNLEVPT